MLKSVEYITQPVILGDMEKIKEVLTIVYGLIGMVVFFAVLFYGGNKIISIITLYYQYVLFVGIPLVVLSVVISQIKSRK